MLRKEYILLDVLQLYEYEAGIRRIALMHFADYVQRLTNYTPDTFAYYSCIFGPTCRDDYTLNLYSLSTLDYDQVEFLLSQIMDYSYEARCIRVYTENAEIQDIFNEHAVKSFISKEMPEQTQEFN